MSEAIGSVESARHTVGAAPELLSTEGVLCRGTGVTPGVAMRAINALMDWVRLSPAKDVVEITLVDGTSSDLPIAALPRARRLEIIQWLVDGIQRALAMDEKARSWRIYTAGKVWKTKYSDEDLERALAELEEIVVVLLTTP